MKQEVLVHVLTLLCVSELAAAQQPDSSRIPSSHIDSAAVVLAPVTIRGSIAPVAGPSVSSGVPASVSTIGNQQLAAWRPRQLPDALRESPGVSTYDDLGSPSKRSISLRGFAVGPTVGLPAGLSVFIDGIRQNEPDAQEVNFDLLPMDVVRRVEVLRGPASLLGPNAIGGAINLITDEGAGAPRGDATVTVGSYGDRSLDASAEGSGAHGLRYFAAAGGDRADGWRAVSGTRGYHGFLNIGGGDNASGVRLQAFGARSRVETAGSLPESIFSRAPRTNFTAGDIDDLTATQIAITANHPLADGSGAASLYVRGSHADRFNANQPPDENVRGLTRGVTEGVSADWRRSIDLGVQRLDVRAGTELSLDQVRVRLFRIPSDHSGLDSVSSDVSSDRENLAAYLLTDLHVGAATVSAGARYDDIRSPFTDRLRSSTTASEYRRLTPRAGIAIDLGHGANVFASLGSSFRPPAILELGCADPSAACPLPFALGDDPPLAPVRALSAEAGGQALVGPVLLRGSAFRTEVRDEIFFVASPASLVSGYFTNLRRTRRAGAELEARGANERLSWFLTYTRTRATFQAPAQIFSVRSDDNLASSALAGPNQVESGDELPLIPRSLATGGIDLRLRAGFSTGIEGRRIGAQWLRGDEANETRPLAPYTTASARIGLRAGVWDLSLVANNVFDARAATFGTFNENRQTGKLERFLTPIDPRALRLAIARSIGSGHAE